MSCAKTTNTTLALAVSAVLATATPIAQIGSGAVARELRW
jgi:hypothetical protein